jgi:hypothetical protein
MTITKMTNILPIFTYYKFSQTLSEDIALILASSCQKFR